MESGSSVSTNAGTTQDGQPETLPIVELVCSICMASPTNPVLTSCGHLFCWPCLYRWLQAQPKPCPVCRTMLRTEINITPIFASNGSSVGSGSSGAHAGPTNASESAIPPRPSPRAPTARVQVDLASARNGFLTLSVVKAAFEALERVHERRRTDLVDRLNEMHEDLVEVRRERSQLQQTVYDVVRRSVVLAREVEERDRRRLGLIREANGTEQQHFHERTRIIAERSATLRSLMARANRPRRSP